MPDFTTTALLASIRRRASVPNASKLGTDNAALLAIATEELWGEVSALLRSIRAGFFRTDYSVALAASTSEYPVPPRAIAGAVGDVLVVGTDGKERSLDSIDPSDLPELDDDAGEPWGYYFKDDAVVVFPTPSAAGETLKLPYFRRCGTLVVATTGASGAIGVVSSFDAGAKTVTLTAAQPTGFTTSQTYDFVSHRPGFKTLDMDLVVTNINVGVPAAPVFTFQDALPSDLAAGNYLCLAQEAPVPQVPPEFHQLLAQAAAVKCLSGPLGDRQALPEAKDELKRIKAELLPPADPRNEDETEVVVNPYFFGGG